MSTAANRSFRAVTTRTGTTILIAAGAAVWAIAGLSGAKSAGFAAVGLAMFAVLARFAHQQMVDARVHESNVALRAEIGRLKARQDETDSRLEAVTQIEEAIEGLSARHEDQRVALGEFVEQFKQVRERLDQVEKVADGARLRSTSNRVLTREALRVVRVELDDVARRLSTVSHREPIVADVQSPILSIAIPSFNRPAELEACLESIVREIEATDASQVEVWITEDCSTVDAAADVAHRFAARYSFIGFRSNPTNLGLERNLIECCVPCTGEFVWIVGNDDLLYAGGLAVVLSDVLSDAHDVFVYDKVRISRDVAGELDPVPGSTPDGVGPGQHGVYPSLLEFARETGILSGFGFISTLVIRRDRLMGASADPYMGLTMYPQVGVLLETCGAGSMLFHNVPVVYHRTTVREEKLAEALGRAEEGFMAGGGERNRRWFGDTLAALLQRVVDRSSLIADDFSEIPELLFKQPSLVDFVQSNREARAKHGPELSVDVLEDATRFFDGLNAQP